jgi:hypothetical protein
VRVEIEVCGLAGGVIGGLNLNLKKMPDAGTSTGPVNSNEGTLNVSAKERISEVEKNNHPKRKRTK